MIETYRIDTGKAPGADVDTIAFIVLYVLWCEQGMAHLIEAYEDYDDEVPASMVLIDFGAEVRGVSGVLQPLQAAPAVSFVIQRLQDLQRRGRDPVFDCMVLSHQDEDHWSMIYYLLQEIEARAIPLHISELRYGGLKWNVAAREMLKALEAYMHGGRAVPWQGICCDYDDTTHTKTDFYNIGNVYFRLLVVNARARLRGDSAVRNASSAVVVIEFAGSTFILPGDATLDTLGWCNQRIEAWTADGTANPLKPCEMFGAPHHGAFATLTDTRKGGANLFTIANRFIELVEPRAVVASAGAYNGFSHPYRSVMEALAARTVDSDDPHQVVVWNKISKKKGEWQVLPLSRRAYTTIVDLPWSRPRPSITQNLREEDQQNTQVIVSDYHFHLDHDAEVTIFDFPRAAATAPEELWTLVEDFEDDLMDEADQGPVQLLAPPPNQAPRKRVVAKARGGA